MSPPRRSPRILLLVASLLALSITACSADDAADAPTDTARAADVAQAGDTGQTADTAAKDAGPQVCAAGLFGAPNDRTGLADGVCAPTCSDCTQPFVAPTIDADDLEAMRTWVCETTFDVPEADPYATDPPAPAGPDAVCALRFLDATATPPTYELQTYDSAALAAADGAFPTHTGGCGACSTLANFAVYAGTTDLTQPVRQCGLDHLDLPGNIACLEGLGFDLACATIWARNTQHTRKACLAPCLAALEQPYHLPDGSLNECLQCDEDESGPVFKAVAGRTRRNSGLASALCRPCGEVRPIDHRAYLDGPG